MTNRDENSIDEFINNELKYFSPMKLRKDKYSIEDLEKFSLETVKQRSERISNEVYDLFEGSVKYGHFRGLKLIKKSTWGVNNLGLMCIGQYEKEVLNFICSGSLNEKKIFIDIGAGVGYYAVGVLNSKLFDSCICFEKDKHSRNLILENWKENGSPGELTIYCDVFSDFKKKLKNIELSEAFFLIDIEGGEFDLLTKKNLIFLSKSIILIEIHNWILDFENKYISLLRLANEFFDIKIIERQEKETIYMEELRSFTDDNRLLLLSESRPCLMRYLILFPKKKKVPIENNHYTCLRKNKQKNCYI